MRKSHTSTGFPSVVKRKNGKKVVIWRWYEKGQDGESRERWKTLGLASRFKSDAAAQQEAERLGLGRPIEEGPRTLKELVDHWLDTECPGTDEIRTNVGPSPLGTTTAVISGSGSNRDRGTEPWTKSSPWP
ncbi:MAG TPA: hypothetical protein VKB49_04075 [Candidatus Sulfotelmatobacter sp.]|nr:hypothetical protein [Candidatus Sulfotelmatobacter sp.]